MKQNKIFAAVLIIALIVTSFSVGSYVTEQKTITQGQSVAVH